MLLTIDGDKNTFSQENVDPVGFLTTKNVYHAEIGSIKTWKDRVVVRGVLKERHHWGKQTGLPRNVNLIFIEQRTFIVNLKLAKSGNY